MSRGLVVLITGGRDYCDRATLYGALDTLHATRGPIERMVHGGAAGADSLAGEWARDRGVECRVYRARWDEHGRSAGPRRNQRMLDEERPDIAVAFAGKRRTADCVRRARKAGVEVIEIGGAES